MTDHRGGVAELARDLVAIDSRSFLSNHPVAERIEAALADFDIERLDYEDAHGVAKRALVAHRGPPGGLALSGHLDTVPATGWTSDPWSGLAVASGVQAHSSTGRGRNANWDLLPFLVEMRAVHERLRTEPALQDADYDPPFSDFNLVIDNHGTAVNVTVAKATATIKFRYSAKIDPTPVVDAVRDAARRAGVTLTEAREGNPPELPPDHPFVRLCSEATAASRVAPYGTDASELQVLAPCVILGPGDIAQAHCPGECVSIAELAAAVPLFMRIAEKVGKIA
jgi:acetylornithine deacetylase/succinyl-diaminopimelate desuccinylase-like protein